jgi:hypothetical protein
MRAVSFAIILFATAAFASDSSTRAKLIGRWQPLESAAKAAKEAGVWTLEAKGGDNLRVTHSLGDQKLSEFECSTTGRECEMKDSGKTAKVSMWFNGAKLVELETKGREVVKRRFAVAGQGDILEVEVIPIVPEGKPETLRFERTQR